MVKKVDSENNNIDKKNDGTKKKEVKKKTVKKSVKKEEKKDELVAVTDEIREVVVERKVGFNYAEVIVIMIITLILGSVVGSFITYVSDDKKETGTTIIEKIPSELEEFVNIYNNILSDYYEDVDRDKLLESGINGMLEYLDDDYSVYMNQEASEDFNEQVEGKYTGIGVEIMQQEDYSVVISKVFTDTPASKAGLKAGDVFVKVGGEEVKDKTPSEISAMIKGSKDKNVEVVVKRDKEEKTFTLTLEEVEIESVGTEVFEKNGKKIGYIELSIFASNTFSQFEKKLLELEGKDIDSLVIDVRDNSGGYLSTVTDIASLFMDKNNVIYQLDTKGVVEKIYASTKTSRKYDIAVIINHNSASASEILAAALQESYGAVVVGTNSFGKGTVQKAYKLDSGATVKYTVQKWLTPKGNWVNEKGVTPDVEVELNGNYYEDPSYDNDTQLQKALGELSK